MDDSSEDDEGDIETYLKQIVNWHKPNVRYNNEKIYSQAAKNRVNAALEEIQTRMNLEAQMMNRPTPKRRDITVQNNGNIEPEIIADYTSFTPGNLSPRHA